MAKTTCRPVRTTGKPGPKLDEILAVKLVPNAAQFISLEKSQYIVQAVLALADELAQLRKGSA